MRGFGVDGTGIAVAVLDSGIDDRDDLKDAAGKSRIVYRESFVPGKDAKDEYGHGSHVAGIIGGNGKKSTGSQHDYQVRGIAPNVRIVALRVLDMNGAGQDSWVIAAIQSAIALKNVYNIGVLNLSLGRVVSDTFKNDPLCQAVEQAWKVALWLWPRPEMTDATITSSAGPAWPPRWSWEQRRCCCKNILR